jgi:hypothetical protein
MRRHGRHWNEAELADLRASYGNEPPSKIAERLGRTYAAIWECARRHGIKDGRNYLTPTRRQYREMLYKECLANGVSYPQALSKSFTQEVAAVRGRVFVKLLAMNYSSVGIASAAGCDPTTVRYGKIIVNRSIPAIAPTPPQA